MVTVSMVATGRGARRRSASSAFGLFLFGLLLLGCSKDPVRPFPAAPSFLPPTIDDYPAWSHSGTTIAYLRFYPSLDGPPGVYVISKWGGTPRQVADVGFLWFRFSPDDRQLVAVSSDAQIAIINIATGQVQRPFYTDNFADLPDWSPDGKSIVYLRGDPTPGEPADSGGIHVFDLETRIDRPLTVAGNILQGIPRAWLPTGEIAINPFDPFRPQRLAVVDPVRGTAHDVYVSRRSDSFWLVTWYSRPSTASWGILFTDNDNPPFGGIFLIRPDGTGLTRMPPFRPYVLGRGHETFSPDGEEWVHHGFDPVDSLDVLFVSHMGDLNGASTRQLTRYSPRPYASRVAAVGYQFARPAVTSKLASIVFYGMVGD
jgi:hypothetical protein